MTATASPALAVSGLCKRYGDRDAVANVSLTVACGSFYGIVGPNGAGKTTTLSMTTGLLRPDSGAALVFGVDVWRDPDRAKALVGVLPDGLSMPERLTGMELLTFVGRMRRMDPAATRDRARELLDVLEIGDDRQLVIQYSTGMRKKMGLATALLHAPRLLVLDEPFEAVDPVSVRVIRGILRRFVQGGGSVVISSHVMAIVEQLCDAVAVMVGGRVLTEGPIGQVCQEMTLEDRFVALVGEPHRGERALSWLAP